MAIHGELKIYVGRPSDPGRQSEDGLVTQAVNAEDIYGENFGGLLAVEPMKLEQEDGYRLKICAAIHEQAIELLGNGHLLVRNLVTGEERIIDGDNEEIRRRIVERAKERLKGSNRRRVRACFFRDEISGNFVWFRKRRKRTATELEQVWQTEVEPATGISNDDAQFYRWATGVFYNRLVISVDDFTDARRDELNAEPRSFRVDWRNDLGLTAQQISDIEDRDTFVDIRPDTVYNLNSVVVPV